nr:PAS domain S-box protein [Halorubellus sp. JP-L1]
MAESAPGDPPTVLEAAPMALVEVDADNVVVRWNRGAESLFGYAKAEALGENLVDLVVPAAERDAVEAVCRRALSTTGTVENVNRNVRKDGSVLTCEWHSTGVTDDAGEVVSSVSLVHDVTDREQRKETIDQLRSVTRELVRADTKASVAEGVVGAAKDILGQQYSAVYLADDGGDLALAARTESFEDVPPLVPGESATLRAFERNEEILVDEGVSEHTTVSADHPIESVFVVPLGDHGTLTFGSPAEGAFDETDAQLASILASATTAALDRTNRERELRLHETIVDTVGAGVFALDGDGYLQTANETLAALTGYDRCDLVGEHATLLVDDATFELATEQVGALADGDSSLGEVLTYEVDLRTADGDAVPCEVNLALLSRGDGRDFEGVAGVVRDVRERKRIQSELGDKRRKIENLHDIASLLDDCGTREDIWRLTVEAAEGILDFDVCGIDEVRGEYLHSVGLSSEIEPQGYKQRAHVSDGLAGKTHRTGESYLVDDVQGENDATPENREYRSLISVPIGEYGVFQAVHEEVGGFDEDDLELAELLMRHVEDALERIEFETRLRGERDRFAALFENVPDPVVQTRHTDDGAIVDAVNPAFECVFGYESEDIVGGNLNEFVVPLDRLAEAQRIDRAGREGQVVEQEVKRQTTDGLRDFQLTAVPVDADAAEPSTFFVYTDITQRKERQKRVEILNRVLRHDLRNGMNIIKGSAEMLQDAVTDSAAVGYADQVIERADDLLGLAEKTRAVERTLDRDSEATGPVSVTESVETSAARIREEYPNARIETDLTADVAVHADDMLRTAIYHVMENAVQHNDRAEPSVRVTANYGGEHEDMLELEVADDGPGIPATERELIGEEREITQLRHASGLGLWLVDWVVSQSGGSVSFDENDPRGTVVTLSVPIASEKGVVKADD